MTSMVAVDAQPVKGVELLARCASCPLAVVACVPLCPGVGRAVVHGGAAIDA